MKKIFLLAIGILLTSGAKVSAMDYANYKPEPYKFKYDTIPFSPATLLFKFARFSLMMALGYDRETKYKIRKNWRMGVDDKLTPGTPPAWVSAKKGIGYNPKKRQTYLPRAYYVPRMKGVGENKAGIFYDIRGIQKHAIQQFKTNMLPSIKKSWENSRSWFEKHPFYFGTFTGLVGAGSALGLKTLWEQHQSCK